MWKELPEDKREVYKSLILAFASLTEMFAQKAEGATYEQSPIINSKYQERVFQKAFGAVAEDIGNTAYDVSLVLEGKPEKKYAVGIKTFGISSGLQKIAQFKREHDEWSSIIEEIKKNAIDKDGKKKSKKAIDSINEKLYMQLAKNIAILRNKRISSAEASLAGFDKDTNSEDIERVYHVLMPSKKGESPKIYVGETDYNKINIDKIKILGCTTPNNPTNFGFRDDKHIYRFTSADTQLLMDFNNKQIVQESWNVYYLNDPYVVTDKIEEIIVKEQGEEQYSNIKESYCWKLLNKNNEVELFSGFNAFFGVGSKLIKSSREKRINSLISMFDNSIDSALLYEIKEMLQEYLLKTARNKKDRLNKVRLRERIIEETKKAQNNSFEAEVNKLIFRPYNEMYIPIKNARNFHSEHPDFFGKQIGTFKKDRKTLALKQEKRQFNLVFEPSGSLIRSFITQECGKAIESVDKQSILGEWILRGIFQLDQYEPLTKEKLFEININGIRLYKTQDSADIHLQFIWIDEENPPKDYIG